MSEYPEDIMNAARRAAVKAYPSASDVIWSGDGDGLYMIPAICSAILAERERCMKIAADAMHDPDPTDEPGDDDWWCSSIANGQAQAIHDRILKGGAA